MWNLKYLIFILSFATGACINIREDEPSTKNIFCKLTCNKSETLTARIFECLQNCGSLITEMEQSTSEYHKSFASFLKKMVFCDKESLNLQKNLLPNFTKLKTAVEYLVYSGLTSYNDTNKRKFAYLRWISSDRKHKCTVENEDITGDISDENTKLIIKGYILLADDVIIEDHNICINNTSYKLVGGVCELTTSKLCYWKKTRCWSVVRGSDNCYYRLDKRSKLNLGNKWVAVKGSDTFLFYSKD